MLTAVSVLETPVATERVYTHFITLIHRQSGHEIGFEVNTLSDRFTDVMREICVQKVSRGLLGYELFEMLDCNVPF